jgi:secreted trypsin-like serine protease
VAESPLKVINGTACTNLSHSPIVRLISDYPNGRPGYCTGTLITSTKVLTAGHCVTDIVTPGNKRTETIVITGAGGDDHFVRAASAEIHPGFKVHSPHIDNDMAIVTLSHPVDLPVLPVLISSSPPLGAEVKVYGYGRTETGTPPYISFQSFLKQPLDLRAGIMVLTEVTDQRLRADAFAGKTTLCHGDSGGPLIYEHNGEPAIAGVTSAVVANSQPVHCAPGTTAEWTRMDNPAVANELLTLVPDVHTR